MRRDSFKLARGKIQLSRKLTPQHATRDRARVFLNIFSEFDNFSEIFAMDDEPLQPDSYVDLPSFSNVNDREEQNILLACRKLS